MVEALFRMKFFILIKSFSLYNFSIISVFSSDKLRDTCFFLYHLFFNPNLISSKNVINA